MPAYDMRKVPRWQQGDDKDGGRRRNDVPHGKKKSDVVSRIAYVKVHAESSWDKYDFPAITNPEEEFDCLYCVEQMVVVYLTGDASQLAQGS